MSARISHVRFSRALTTAPRALPSSSSTTMADAQDVLNRALADGPLLRNTPYVCRLPVLQTRVLEGPAVGSGHRLIWSLAIWLTVLALMRRPSTG